MPGLIDAHCHVSYGYPSDQGRGQRQGHHPAGILHPEVGAQRAEGAALGRHQDRGAGRDLVHRRGRARRHQARRDGGPAHVVAGRMIVTYGCIEDDEPSWEGTPDHSIGKLCNTADEMVTEVRRQGKHGVNFIKMADSRSGELQMLAREEIAAVVGEAHRRNLRVGFIRAARARPAPPPKPASIGSCMPISPPTETSRRSPRPGCRSSRPRPSWGGGRTRQQGRRRAGAARHHPHVAALRPARAS